MIKAPPIIGPLDFFGFKNNIIFVRHEDESSGLELIGPALHGLVVILTPFPNDVIRISSKFKKHCDFLVKQSTNICDLYKAIKSISKQPEAKVSFYVIDGADHFNVDSGNRIRGSIIKSYISMCASPRILNESNIVITSSHAEYGIQETADHTILCH